MMKKAGDQTIGEWYMDTNLGAVKLVPLMGNELLREVIDHSMGRAWLTVQVVVTVGKESK